jgi:RNA polymerase sigma factor (sigma-70 family)
MPVEAVQLTMKSPTAYRDEPAQAEAMADAENELVQQARAGDENAFRTLMDRHRDHAYGIALRITRSPEDAEDVTQQAFVRAWFALGQFRSESRFGTWLHRIVARRALDRASQMKARQAREDDIDVESLSVSFSGNLGRDVILIRRLEQMMRRLTAAQRAVVTLFYWDETPVEEIAGALGMPENTVKTHLSRARATLREAWLKMEGKR